MEPIKISASKLSLADECFGKYYYRYIEKPDIKSVCWPGTIQGTVNHLLLEESLHLRKKGVSITNILYTSLEKFESEVQKEYDKRRETEILKYPRNYNYEDFIRAGKTYIAEFIRYTLKEVPENAEFQTEAEISVELKNPDVLVRGFIDLMYRDSSDDIHILDYKNTNEIQKWRDMDWSQDIQSKLYILMAYKKYGKLPKTFSYLVLDKKWTKVNQFTFNVKSDFLQNNGFGYIEKKIHDLVKNSLFHNTDLFTPTDDKCRWCDYKKICPKSIYT